MLSRYHAIRARRARGEDQGFSLIELLVVVVIMGILIAIAVPVYLNYQNNAKKKSVEADVRNAIPAVEQCIVDNHGSFGDDCGVKADHDDDTDGYINVSPNNTIEVKAGDDGSYVIEGTREDPDYTVTYTSVDGKTVTDDDSSSSGSSGSGDPD